MTKAIAAGSAVKLLGRSALWTVASSYSDRITRIAKVRLLSSDGRWSVVARAADVTPARCTQPVVRLTGIGRCSRSATVGEYCAQHAGGR